MNIARRPDPANAHSLVLNNIAGELLSASAEDDRLRAAAAELYSLCSSVSGITDDSDGSVVSSGTAISPAEAARCVLDYKRTSRFVRGLYAAILEAQQRFPDATIEILYAGCGPFAPLALPLTTRFKSGEIKFTLLDLHRRSLDAARNIFEAVGKSAFVRDYVECDAASYKHDAPHDIHIVVAETMQAALEKEPQVAITLNLAPQLCRGGIFVPERIAVDCYLCELTEESPAGSGAIKKTKLGRLLELTAETCSLSQKLLNVSRDIAGEFHLMLSTTIDVFDSIVLDEYESGLTCPKFLFDAGKVRRGESIEFNYQLGLKPGFRYTTLP